METTHEVHVGDARDLPLPDGSVDLVVTSPPYPMIEMWDESFATQDPRVGDALEAGDGERAFEAMHDLLADAWAECFRVLRAGGIAVVNVGDAVRKVDGEFRQYPNHAEITRRMREQGFSPLPDVLWRKPANSAATFMGSGMRPPNAYVTLEHEYLLVFRKGDLRRPPGEARDESAYFWEERNRWFSDLWEVTGTDQGLGGARERSGAFPIRIPYRLVCMFSTYGERVLDPFWGTGTTTEAAMCAGRSSVGVERDPSLAAAFDPDGVPERSREIARERLDDHREFVAEHDGDLDYEAEHYDVPVKTGQERAIRLYRVREVEEHEEGYRALHEPV